MTDVMLDQILADTREPEAFDDSFVRMVMDEVKVEEQRRWRLRLVRRPVVFGVAAVVLATSGAVAALVGTHVTPKTVEASSSPRSARVTVSAGPSASSASRVVSPSSSSDVASPSAPSAAKPLKGIHWGFPTDHTAWVVDDDTGLKLTTETDTNAFTVGKKQPVTLTLLNTSADPIAISGLNGCAVEVIATPTGGKPLAPACATGGVSNDRVVLAPGGFYTAVANVTLPKAGNWTIVSTCRCAYTQPTKATPQKSNDPFGSLLQKAAPPPILPQKNAPQSGVARLTTPPITVKASS